MTTRKAYAAYGIFLTALVSASLAASERTFEVEKRGSGDGGTLDTSAAPAGNSLQKAASEAPGRAEADRRITEYDLELVENKTSYMEVASGLSRLGAKNVKVHPGESNVGYVISADGMDFLPVFGLFGYMGKIDLSAFMVKGAVPRNYAVKINKHGIFMVTAEDLVMQFPNGVIKYVFLAATWEGRNALANMHEIATSRIRKNMGFFRPRFYESMEGDEVYLHAKDENGNDWPDALALSPETGDPKEWVNWADVKPYLNLYTGS